MAHTIKTDCRSRRRTLPDYSFIAMIAHSAVARYARWLVALLLATVAMLVFLPNVASAQGSAPAVDTVVMAQTPVFWYLLAAALAMLVPTGLVLLGVSGLEPELAWRAGLAQLALLDRERLPLARQRVQLTLAAYRGGSARLADVLAERRAALALEMERIELQLSTARLWAQLEYLIPGSAPQVAAAVAPTLATAD